MCLSSVRSATSVFSFRFSSLSWRSSRNSLSPNPAYPLPAVKRLLRYSHFAADLAYFLASFRLPQRVHDLLFGVSPVDPITFLGSSAALVAVVIAAAYFPARRATRVDAVELLRET